MIELQGKRLLHMPTGPLLSLVWSHIYGETSEEGRRTMQLLAQGTLGAGGGEIIFDENLPPELQGKEAPVGWSVDYDPFEDTW